MNLKQGSIPREAAIAIVKLVNQRDTQTSELAISLLDNLVKNCGYPFHLQISRKEFLNELVKKFPERPPPRYTRIQRLILGQIEEWYQTICKTSKYKDDFTYIKDMHRLLSNKGYVFPELKLEDAAVLNPLENLKSMEVLRKEEAVVHLAKLQELIRRGKPQDLQEANKLMKIMAGFKDDSAESKKQIDEDLERLKRKVEILNEMINSGALSSKDSTEAMSELYLSIKSSQPSITKIIEEQEEQEGVDDLLALNDNINTVFSKYTALKGGQHVEPSGLASSEPANLIDFDDDAPSVAAQTDKEQGYNDLLSDLSNLTFNGSNNVNPLNLYGAGGSISLGLQQPTPQAANNVDLLGMSSPSPQLQSNTAGLGEAKDNKGLDPFGFNFPTSSPAQVQKGSTQTLSQSESLKVEISKDLSSTNTFVQGRVLLSNLQLDSISQLKFLIAVAKNCKLSLKPQLSDYIGGFQQHGIVQEFSIENSTDKPLKVKWKVEYVIGGQQKEESGVNVLE